MPSGAYNNNYQIVQTANNGQRFWLNENDVRAIRMNSEHAPKGVEVAGHPVGHWTATAGDRDGERELTTAFAAHPINSKLPNGQRVD
jgi:hypothetical protein